MLKITLFLLLGRIYAWETGNAPFCAMDNYGNTQCYYYDMLSCKRAINNKPGSSCVKR